MKTLVALVVDDSLLVRNTLKDIIITQGGFAVAEAANGKSAVEKYRELRPDLVFLDIVMPLQDGIEVLANIKVIDPHARVVMVSAVGTYLKVEKAIRLGAADFIQKPFERSRVISILEEVMRKSTGDRD